MGAPIFRILARVVGGPQSNAGWRIRMPHELLSPPLAKPPPKPDLLEPEEALEVGLEREIERR